MAMLVDDCFEFREGAPRRHVGVGSARNENLRRVMMKVCLRWCSMIHHIATWWGTAGYGLLRMRVVHGGAGVDAFVYRSAICW